MDFNRRYWIIDKFVSLRLEIPRRVQSQLEINNPKIIKYFKRAFPRWIFNVIRKGKNPFKDRLLVNDFVLQEDVEYLLRSLLDEKVFVRKSTSVREMLQKISWEWLDREFVKIYSGSTHDIVFPQRINIQSQEDVVIVSRSTYRFKLHAHQYTNSYLKFCGDRGDFNETFFLLLFQYKGCGGHNNHCSAPPGVIKFTGAHTELFGSPFNTCLEQYCSPFYDVEKYFGSLGSFFDFDFQTGIYFMNPPYDEQFMKFAAQKVLMALNSTKEISVIVVLPLWDPRSQIEHRGKMHVDKEFEAYEMLKKSKHLRSTMVLSHDVHKFYDYYIGGFSGVADAHLMVLSNTVYQITAQEIASVWAKNVF